MDYVVTAGLEPPVDAPGLDALQREGVAALLDRQLALVEGVAGGEDDDIDVLDYRITVHPNGASVLLALDAPSLISAESAAATVLDELLGESDLLTGWTVADSEVRITEDEFNQSLAAASETESTRLGDAESALEAAIEEALEGSDSESQEPALDTEHWRIKLVESAARLRAFDVSAFAATRSNGEVSEQSHLAAGALIHAVRVVTDEIFYDELALAINNTTVADAVGLLVLEELPSCYEEQYDSLFARGFLLSSAAVATRLAEPHWVPPRCVAEALALRLFINEARVLLEAAELMAWEESERIFAGFGRRAFTDVDHEELYDVDVTLSDENPEPHVKEIEVQLRARGLAFDQWFEPRGVQAETDGLHPYLQSF